MINRFQKISSIAFLLTFVCVGKEYKSFGKIDTKYSSLRQKKKLFASVGCQYFNAMEVNVSDFDQIHPTQTEYYLNSSTMILWLSKKYYMNVLNYDLAPMYLKWISKDVGYGVFAKEDIAKDDFIGVYAGQLRLARKIDDDIPENVDYAWYYPISTFNGTRLLVDGQFKGNELRFINHDEHPNTKCENVLIDGVFYMIYVAIENIAKDVQLTISYGNSYWTSRAVDPKRIKS